MALNYLIAFGLIICLNFILPRLMPGDPLSAIYGDEALANMTPALKAQLIERFSLDQATSNQLYSYLQALFHGDLGHSFFYNAPVSDVIAGALPWTLLLVGSSLLASTFLGAVLGIESGWRRNKAADKCLLTSLIMLSGFPNFFIGVLLMIFFGITLSILPVGGALTPYADLKGLALAADAARHLVLPFLALTITSLAGSYLLTRNTMILTLGEPFILTAKAKGLSERAIRYKHAGRCSILPVVTRAGVRIGTLFTSVLFVETVFSYPGLGYLLHKALMTRDYPLIQGVLLVIALFVLTSSFLIDFLYVKLDPRVKNAH